MAANPTAVRTRPPAQAAARPVPPKKAKPPPPLWRKLYDRYGTAAGMTLAALAIFVGYAGRDSRRLFAEQGLGYALGIVGSLLILTLLLYPLRKRIKLLKVLGPVKNWFRVHMMLGVVGPLAILYHSNFALGSVNSTAAMLSMLLVAGSGLVGRFLYAKVHKGLYGRKTNLKELLGSVKLSTAETGGAAQFIPDLMKMVAEYDRQVLKPPSGIVDSMTLPLRLMFKTRMGYRSIVARVGEQLDEQAARSPVVRQHRDRLFKLTKAFVREHLKRVRRVAAFAAYDRLFSLWHKVHLPFFYLLIVTAIVHVIAVHLYSI
ncbi:MAG: hypothetical protein AAFX56_10115 [Pseudomonadota bacterium]